MWLPERQADVRALILRWEAMDRGGIGSDLGFRKAPSGSWVENRVGERGWKQATHRGGLLKQGWREGDERWLRSGVL